jgi:hypothetical protein
MPHMYGLGEQIHLDPGCEKGANSLNTRWWGNYFNCPRVREQVDPHGGSWSVLYTKDSGVNAQGAVCYGEQVFGRGTFRVSAWVKATAGLNLKISVRAFRRGTGLITESGAQVLLATTGQWQQIQTNSWVLPQPVVVALQIVTDSTAPIGTAFRVDDLKIEQIA